MEGRVMSPETKLGLIKILTLGIDTERRVGKASCAAEETIRAIKEVLDEE